MFDELDGRGIYCQSRDPHLVMKKERHDRDTDIELFCLNKRHIAEGRVVGDNNVFCDKAALHEGEGKLLECHITSKGAGKLGFYRRPEGFSIDKERHKKNDEKENAEYQRTDDKPSFFHPVPFLH
jgi:hypothetical protein